MKDFLGIILLNTVNLEESECVDTSVQEQGGKIGPGELQTNKFIVQPALHYHQKISKSHEKHM